MPTLFYLIRPPPAPLRPHPCSPIHPACFRHHTYPFPPLRPRVRVPASTRPPPVVRRWTGLLVYADPHPPRACLSWRITFIPIFPRPPCDCPVSPLPCTPAWRSTPLCRPPLPPPRLCLCGALLDKLLDVWKCVRDVGKSEVKGFLDDFFRRTFGLR